MGTHATDPGLNCIRPKFLSAHALKAGELCLKTWFWIVARLAPSSMALKASNATTLHWPSRQR